MIIQKGLTTIEDFENLKRGDKLACEFYRNMHDYPKKPYRFNIFSIAKVRKDTKEVILQVKNNLYFNYEFFVNGKKGNLKQAILISCDCA